MAAGMAFLGLCLGCLAGCHTTASRIPVWIDRPPVNESYLFAVGSYVGSLYPEDNRKNAQKDAIQNLSAQIKTHVVDRLKITHGGASASMQRQAEMVADNLVENSQVLEWWVDREGLIKDGLPGTVYCLVRAPMENIERMLR